MNDVLKKPVHVVLLKPTYMQQLQAEGRLPEAAEPYAPPLPAEPPPKPKVHLSVLSGITSNLAPMQSMHKEMHAEQRARQRWMTLPSIPKDQIPPCNSCKTAACCVAFLVNLTQDEYDSGLYGKYAVEITPEAYEQLGSTYIAGAGGAPYPKDRTEHYLEGIQGTPCPFLGKDKECTIYNIRPQTCRTYTCVTDPRITQAMREGE